MVSSLFITFRETLEASLVVGIILALLYRTSNHARSIVVWLAVAAAVMCAALLALIFLAVSQGFTGRAEAIYEGCTMLLAALLISWMVVWLVRQGGQMRQAIETKVAVQLEKGALLGIFFLTFFNVLREGVETVIFLQATLLQTGQAMTGIGAVLGIVTAVALAYLLFRGMLHTRSLKYFFGSTSVFLILFGAGLVAHGLHELHEAGLLPSLIDHVWDLNPAVLPDGSYPLWHEEGTIGALLKAVFGYNADPSLLEVLGYGGYLLGFTLFYRAGRKRQLA